MKKQIDLMLMSIKIRKEKKYNIAGYPSYPANEDIYSKFREEKEINPEDITKKKDLNEDEKVKALHEKYILDEMCGNYLDVPGSELDDEQEKIGSEDEENNYYSIGGDAHNNLDETKG
jgi:hypothetical protein